MNPAVALSLAVAAIAGTGPAITRTTSGKFVLGKDQSESDTIIAAEAKRLRKAAKRLAELATPARPTKETP